MAEIYLGSVPEGAGTRSVAIKVINRENANDPDFVRMLLDEAKLSVQLIHPNIVHTYDLGREKDQYYIVMEFIDGSDLFKIEQRASQKRLSFPLALAAFVAKEVSHGLHFAHGLRDQEGRELHIVHRDISPQNILLSMDGQVKITDFGIAKAAYRAEQTQVGIIKGKYYYMSPEQAHGWVLDRRTDVFATGILLYEMLVGEMLYFDENMERLLAMVRKAEIVPPSKKRRDIPPMLEAIVMRALRRKVDERYATSLELAQALGEFLREHAPGNLAADVGALVTRVLEQPPRQKRRSSEAILQWEPRLEPEGDEEPSPTQGIDPEAILRLKIKDENSLIFGSDSRLRALIQGAARAADQPSGGETSGSMGVPTLPKVEVHRAMPDESDVRTRRRPLPAEDGSELSETAKTSAKQPRPIGLGTPSGPTRNVVVSPSAVGEDSEPWRTNLPTRKHQLSPEEIQRASEKGEDELRRAGSSLSFELMPAIQPLEDILELEDERERSRKHKGSAAVSAMGERELQQSGRYDSGQDVRGPEVLDADLDLISIESTHKSLQPPPPRPRQPHLPSDEPQVVLMQSEAAAEAPAAAPAQQAPPKFLLARNQAPNQPINKVISHGVTAFLSALLAGGVVWWMHATQFPAPMRGEVDAGVPLPKAQIVLLPGPVEEPPPLGEVLPTDATPTEPSDTPGKTNQGLGTLTVESDPPGAEVVVKRKKLGVTPLVLPDLPLDSDVKVELRLTGYETKSKRVRWKDKDHQTLRLTLRPAGEPEADQSPAPQP